MGRAILIITLIWSSGLFAHASSEGNFEHPDLILEQVTKLATEYERLTQDFGPGDIVVFDLDNTVFREVQMLGTDEWYSHRVQFIRKGRSPSEAALRLVGLNVAIKSASRMKLMEPEIPELIHRLQARGITVIGLTARHPKLSESTLGQLKVFDIDFSHSGFSDSALKNFKIQNMKNDLLYRGGVAFTDGATKGVVLKHMMLQTHSQPKRIAAIDDRAHHMESYVEVIQEFGAVGRLILYLKVAEEDPMNPAIARVQEQVFEKLGLLLSDAEAKLYLDRSSEWDVKNWSCSRLLARRWN